MRVQDWRQSMAWRASDLTPTKLFSWRHLKGKRYKNNPNLIRQLEKFKSMEINFIVPATTGAVMSTFQFALHFAFSLEGLNEKYRFEK